MEKCLQSKSSNRTVESRLQILETFMKHSLCLPLRQLVEKARLDLWEKHKEEYQGITVDGLPKDWGNFCEFILRKDEYMGNQFVSILNGTFKTLSQSIHVTDGDYNKKLIAFAIKTLGEDERKKYEEMFMFSFSESVELYY